MHCLLVEAVHLWAWTVLDVVVSCVVLCWCRCSLKRERHRCVCAALVLFIPI